MASGAYREGVRALANKERDWDTDTVKVMAVKTGYVLDKNAHVFLSDVSASRYVGTTDQTLGGKSIDVATAGRCRLKGGAVTFTAVALDGANAVIGYIHYFDTGVAGTSPLVAFDDTNDVTPNGGDIVYTPDATAGVVDFQL